MRVNALVAELRPGDLAATHDTIAREEATTAAARLFAERGISLSAPSPANPRQRDIVAPQSL